MNVLVLTMEFPPLFVGGISLFTYETCKYLSNKGWKITVLTFGEDEERIENKDNMKVLFLRRPNIELDYEKAFINQNKCFKLAINNLYNKNEKFDLIVVHGYFLGEAAIYAKKAFNKPLIYHSHTDYNLNLTLNDHANKNCEYSYICEELLCNLSCRIISVSKYLTTLLINNFSCKNKIITLPKGVDLKLYNNFSIDKSKVYHDDFRIVFVGRISQDKGVEVLLQTISIVKSKIDKKINLYLIGTAINSEYLNYIQNLCKTLDIANNVCFLGYKNAKEVSFLFFNSDVAVVPSFGETFGKVVIESMAAKTPVICSDIGGLSELVKHGFNGLKFPVGNVKQLSKCILDLYYNKELYSKIVDNAYEYVSKNFNISVVLDDLEKIYKKSILLEEKKYEYTLCITSSR